MRLRAVFEERTDPGTTAEVQIQTVEDFESADELVERVARWLSGEGKEHPLTIRRLVRIERAP